MGTSHVEVAQAKVRQAQEWVETCQRSSKEAITPDQKRRRKETLEGAKKRLKAAKEELARAKKMARK